MTAAQLVNLISDKLRTGRVEFVSIWEDGPNAPIYIEFAYGFRVYKLTYQEYGQAMLKLQISSVINEFHTSTDQFSIWMEGVLNGKTRDDNGVLS